MNRARLKLWSLMAFVTLTGGLSFELVYWSRARFSTVTELLEAGKPGIPEASAAWEVHPLVFAIFALLVLFLLFRSLAGTDQDRSPRRLSGRRSSPSPFPRFPSASKAKRRWVLVLAGAAAGIVATLSFVYFRRETVKPPDLIQPAPEALAGLIVFPSNVYQETGKLLSVTVPDSPSGSSRTAAPAKLEIEILAAGIVVSGDQKQVASLSNPPLHFQWNCYFKESGDFVITLVYTLIHSDGSREYLKAPQYPVRVNRIDHMTERQVWIVAVLLGIPALLSVILGLVKVAQEIGIWPRAGARTI
jgi:hypothetical protein